MKTNRGLVEYSKLQLGRPYWYGTFGQIATEDLFNSKKAQYPKYYTASDFKSQYGQRVHDCVGLIKGYLWSDTNTSKPRYNSSQDKSAAGMYNASTEKGKIATMPDIPGILVYKTNGTSINHVGVYIGEGSVIEAKGHTYGTIKSSINSGWTLWGKCPYITYETTKTIDELAREVIEGKWKNYPERKTLLEKAGYNYSEVQKRVNELLR